MREEGWPLAVVLNEQRVVLGRLRLRALREHPDAVAEEIVVEGPRTVRGTRPADQLAAWLLQQTDLSSAGGVKTLVEMLNRADRATGNDAGNHEDSWVDSANARMSTR